MVRPGREVLVRVQRAVGADRYPDRREATQRIETSKHKSARSRDHDPNLRVQAANLRGSAERSSKYVH